MQIGFVNGCFDELHEGHRLMLAECLANCEYLVIALNSDRWIRKKKGPGRPSQDWRMRMWAIYDWHVDLRMTNRGEVTPIAVVPFEGDDQGLLMHIRPNILFKGYDHSSLPIFYRKVGWKKLPDGEKIFEGPKIHQCQHLPGFSTTAILEQRNAKAERVIPDAQDLPG